jgi:NADH:ubiquinone oxidoreductase subunit 4 (subunit M)
MGLLLVGLVSFSSISQKGFLLLLISHGLVSSALFLLVGSLYIRTGTRTIIYYRGLSQIMPIFSILFFIILLFNASFPPSLSYYAELNLIAGIFNYELIGSLSILIALFLSGAYSISLFRRISFSYASLNHYRDLTLREFNMVLPLILLSLFIPLII